MERMRFIVHEEFTGKRNPEDVFAAVLFIKCRLIDGTRKIKYNKKHRPIQDSLCFGKGAKYGTSES